MTHSLVQKLVTAAIFAGVIASFMAASRPVSAEDEIPMTTLTHTASLDE